MRWVKRIVIGAAFVCSLPVCAGVSSAQEVARSYIFLEVLDETDKPVPGAAAVMYNESGKEIGSVVTDLQGAANVFEKTWHSEPPLFILRILKPGYMTYEVAFKALPERQWLSDHIKVKLVPVTKFKAAKQCAAAAPHETPILSLHRASSSSTKMPHEHPP